MDRPPGYSRYGSTFCIQLSSPHCYLPRDITPSQGWLAYNTDVLPVSLDAL